MTHEIEQDTNGNAYAFYARGLPAWHQLGTLLDGTPDVETACKLAYPFELFKLDLEASVVDSNGNKSYAQVNNSKVIFRSDGKEIATVGKDYELLQPWTSCNFFQPYLDSGLVTLEAGMSLRDGTRLCFLAKIKDDEIEILPNDTVKAHLLVATSFDGSLPHIIKPTETRVVCANTLAIALGEKGSEWKFRHTKNIHTRIDEVQNNIQHVLIEHRKQAVGYKALARKQVTPKAMKTYIRNVFAPDIPDSKLSTQMSNKLISVEDLLESQRGLELVPAMRGTAWQAYNAVSEHLTHHASREDDTRVNNMFFGQADTLNKRALELAFTM